MTYHMTLSYDIILSYIYYKISILYNLITISSKLIVILYKYIVLLNHIRAKIHDATKCLINCLFYDLILIVTFKEKREDYLTLTTVIKPFHLLLQKKKQGERFYFYPCPHLKKQFRTNTKNFKLFNVQSSGSIEQSSKLLNQNAS